MTTAAMTPVEVEHVRALYGGVVTFVDAKIGKFLQKVETLGLTRNTIVVFIADHGTMMGEQNQIHKDEKRIHSGDPSSPGHLPPTAEMGGAAHRRVRAAY
jgi:arylsulfatase A-like enzyme